MSVVPAILIQSMTGHSTAARKRSAWPIGQLSDDYDALWNDELSEQITLEAQVPDPATSRL